MICSICRENIVEPVHVEINALLVKHDSKYVGTINFTPEERGTLKEVIQVHRKCWKNLLEIKSSKVLEFKNRGV